MDKREVIGKVVSYKHKLSDHFDIDKVVLFGSPTGAKGRWSEREKGRKSEGEIDR